MFFYEYSKVQSTRMNCEQYTYTSIPEQLKANFDEDLFNYIKDYHIRRANVVEKIDQLLVRNNHVLQELNDAVHEVVSGISEQTCTTEFIGNTISKLEAKLEKITIENLNWQDVMDSIDTEYAIMLGLNGFTLSDRTQDEYVYAFINDGNILN